MTKKKNVLMRSAGLLLALVLVTSCFVGSTFAKYTVGGKGDDTARVAKFGVAITANGATFAKEYATDDQGVVGTIAKSVVSSDDSKLVAPGTKGDMVSMTLQGTPEVAVQVTYLATVTLNDNWVNADGKFYCPLQIKVTSEEGTNGVTICGLDFDSKTAFQTAVAAEISQASAKYAAKTDLSTAVTPAVSWAWAYNGGALGEGQKIAQTDEDDTYLGDQAAKGNAAEIQLTVQTTVTQID